MNRCLCASGWRVWLVGWLVGGDGEKVEGLAAGGLVGAGGVGGVEVGEGDAVDGGGSLRYPKAPAGTRPARHGSRSDADTVARTLLRPGPHRFVCHHRG